MKRKFQSAYLEDVDPRTEEPIRSTQTSASISPSAHESYLQRRTWRKSGEQHLFECRDSEDLGSVLDVISKTKENILTIVAGENEDNKDVWEECERVSREQGKRLRVFYWHDIIINGESETYIARRIPISAAHGDLSAANPSLIIGQRTISPTTGRVLLKAHKLHFGPQQVDLDRPYIFSRLGDELPGLNCPDLHITFRSVRDWESVLKKGSFVGADRDVTVEISRADLREAGKRIVYDFDRDCRVREDEGKPGFGISVEAGELGLLLGGGEKGAGRVSGEFPSPPGKRRRAEGRSLGVKIIGVGPEIPGHSFRADINVNFVLKS